MSCTAATRCNALSLFALCVALPALPRTALAQALPNEPIAIVEPYAVGGTTDDTI